MAPPAASGIGRNAVTETVAVVEFIAEVEDLLNEADKVRLLLALVMLPIASA